MDDEYIGLECPHCGCKHSSVAETRKLCIRGHQLTLRVRRCRYCKRTFKSKEVTDQNLSIPSTSDRLSHDDPDPLDQLIENQAQKEPKRPSSDPPSLLPP